MTYLTYLFWKKWWTGAERAVRQVTATTTATRHVKGGALTGTAPKRGRHNPRRQAGARREVLQVWGECDREAPAAARAGAQQGALHTWGECDRERLVAAPAGMSSLCQTNTGAMYEPYKPTWPEAEARDLVDKLSPTRGEAAAK